MPGRRTYLLWGDISGGPLSCLLIVYATHNEKCTHSFLFISNPEHSLFRELLQQGSTHWITPTLRLFTHCSLYTRESYTYLFINVMYEEYYFFSGKQRNSGKGSTIPCDQRLLPRTAQSASPLHCDLCRRAGFWKALRATVPIPGAPGWAYNTWVSW